MSWIVAEDVPLESGEKLRKGTLVEVWSGDPSEDDYVGIRWPEPGSLYVSHSMGIASAKLAPFR